MKLNRLSSEEIKAQYEAYLGNLETEYGKFRETMFSYIGWTSALEKEELHDELWRFGVFIDEFEDKVKSMPTDKRDNALKHLEKLKHFHNLYGKYFFESIAYRIRNKELETAQFTWAEKVRKLEKQIDILNKQIEF